MRPATRCGGRGDSTEVANGIRINTLAGIRSGASRVPGE